MELIKYPLYETRTHIVIIRFIWWIASASDVICKHFICNGIRYLPMVLTLSEDREGGGVEADVLMPTLSEDLQRDTSVIIIKKFVVIFYTNGLT